MLSLTQTHEAILSTQEQGRLDELEHVIAEGLESFLKVGSSLLEIRSSRLYRSTHNAFKAYCRDRWTLSVSRCNQLIGATKVCEHLTTAFPEDTLLLKDSNEQLFRPLTSLSPELQTAVWELIRRIEETPNAPRVKHIVAQVQDAIEDGWQKRGLSMLNGNQNRAESKTRRISLRASNQLGTLSRWANKVNTWDPKAIAAADDELTLKRHLKAARSLYRFCEEFITAIEKQLANYQTP